MNNDMIFVELDDKEIEDYERDDRNIVQVRITQNGKLLSEKGAIVELILSPEAMIGLATQLLRKAYHNETERVLAHLRPSSPEFATVAMGLYMHPDSQELIIVTKDMGDLDTLFNDLLQT
jgi:hypothetical protein